jgi:transglutaminase superfamily protein
MSSPRGLSCPVTVVALIDWERSYDDTSLAELLAMSDEQLAAVDPLAMNLVVAKGIPSLAALRIGRYQATVNAWVRDFTERCLPRWESFFHQSPQDFRNDIRYFRLGMVCQYLELEIGIQYNADQRELTSILYTDASDLFLNGVIDTRQGTCGNLAALHVAFGWRLGWPVSLACVHSHFISRFDDGRAVFNIEATQSDYGGFKSDPDEYLIAEKKLPPIAITSGSDLRALRPREVLGQFIGLRARHARDVGIHEGNESKILASEPDWLLARQLCPTSRQLYRNQLLVTTMRGDALFEPTEVGHPSSHVGCLKEIRTRRRGRQTSQVSSFQRSTDHPRATDEVCFELETNLCQPH